MGSKHSFHFAAVALLLAGALSACGEHGAGREEAAAPANPPAATGASDRQAPAAPAAAAAKPAAAPQGPDPVPNQGRGVAQRAHLVLGGDYKADDDVPATCAYFPNRTFQVSLPLNESPTFVLEIESFHGAGEYEAVARLRSSVFVEALRESRGKAKTKIEVIPGAGAGKKDRISGTFAGDFIGEAGQGTVSGSFESCEYELPEFNG